MSVRCPDGHTSESTDYCDVCGLPIGAGSSPAASAPPAAPSSSLDLDPPAAAHATKACPNCGAEARADDLFCEDCGYDFTTGALPAPSTNPVGISTPVPDASTPVTVSPGPGGSPSSSPDGGQVPAGPDSGIPLTWVAEIWVDPDWYATQESDEACPSAGMPAVRPLWDTSVLVGRRSNSRNINPQIEVGADNGVSRRHAQLTTDGQRWWAEDLQSSNGTYIGAAGAPIPTVPIPAGQRTEFVPGDRIYLGAWTRIVVRKATPDEQ